MQCIVLGLGKYAMGRRKGRIGRERCATYEKSNKRTNFVRNAACNPLTNQPQTDVLRRKHDSPYFARENSIIVAIE